MIRSTKGNHVILWYNKHFQLKLKLSCISFVLYWCYHWFYHCFVLFFVVESTLSSREWFWLHMDIHVQAVVRAWPLTYLTPQVWHPFIQSGLLVKLASQPHWSVLFMGVVSLPPWSVSLLTPSPLFPMQPIIWTYFRQQHDTLWYFAHAQWCPESWW